MTIYEVQRSIRSFYTGENVFVRSNLLYSAIEDSLVEVDLYSGECTYYVISEADPIVNFSISHDGSVGTFVTQSTLMWVFDLESKKIIRSWKGHNAVSLATAIDYTNQIIAVAFNDRSLRLWNCESGSCLQSIKGFSSHCTSLVFPNWGLPIPLLFCGTLEGRLFVFDTDGKCLFKKEDAHASAITGIEFSPCNRYFGTFSRDKVMSLWSMKNFKSIKSLMVYEGLESGAFIISDENEKEESIKMAIGGEKGVVSVWDIMKGTCLMKEIDNTKFSKNPQSITKILSIGTNKIISFNSEHTLKILQIGKKSVSSCITLNGHKEEITDLSVLNEHLVISTNSEIVKVFDRKKIFECQELAGHAQIVLCVSSKSFSGSDYIISGSKDHVIKLWSKVRNSDQFECLVDCIGHTEAVGALAFSHSQNELNFVSASEDKTIKLWKVSCTIANEFTANGLYTIKGHDKDINFVAVSPNDKFFASCSQDKTAKLWNFEDGSLVGTFKGHKRGVSCVLFHPIEQILATASADKTIKLWSASNFNCLKTFEGHSSSILKISFIKNGTEIVSVGSDGLVKVWNLKSGDCTSTFDEHSDKIWAIAFSADSAHMYTGGADSTIKVWQDVTEEQKQLQIQKQNLIIETEQKLSNLLKMKDYKNAVHLAFKLEQPYKLYGILNELIRGADFAKFSLTEILHSIPIEQWPRLIEYCREWNTSFQKSAVAQVTLSVVFESCSAHDLLRLPEMHKNIEALIPYTERHVRKLDELKKNTYLIDYILAL